MEQTLMQKRGRNGMEKKLGPLLRPEDVAAILQIKLSTVYKYSMSGKLPTVKIYGALRFREDQILTFIEQHTKPAIKPKASA